MINIRNTRYESQDTHHQILLRKLEFGRRSEHYSPSSSKDCGFIAHFSSPFQACVTKTTSFCMTALPKKTWNQLPNSVGKRSDSEKSLYQQATPCISSKHIFHLQGHSCMSIFKIFFVEVLERKRHKSRVWWALKSQTLDNAFPVINAVF